MGQISLKLLAIIALVFFVQSQRSKDLSSLTKSQSSSSFKKELLESDFEFDYDDNNENIIKTNQLSRLGWGEFIFFFH
jgi:hypothetical protein